MADKPPRVQAGQEPGVGEGGNELRSTRPWRLTDARSRPTASASEQSRLWGSQHPRR